MTYSPSCTQLKTRLSPIPRRYRIASALCIALLIAPVFVNADNTGWNCQQINVNGRDEWQCNAASAKRRSANPAASKPDANKTATPDAASTKAAIAAQPPSSPEQPSAITPTSVSSANTNSCGMASDTSGTASEEASTASLFDFETQRELPINATAKSVDIEKNKVILTDAVQFQQGDIELTADRGIVDTQANTIAIDGNIRIQSPAGTIAGDSAQIDSKNNSSEIINAQYALTVQPANGSAQRISSNRQQQIVIEQGSYSSCPNERKLWTVKASEIVLDTQTNQGSAKHARLELLDVPIMYVPYARFPIGSERQSGVLFPTLANTNSGVDITLPFYANIATNWDATLSPRYKNGHGYITEAETRWLNRFDYWEVSGAYLGHDAMFESENALFSASPDDSRWALSVKESGANRAGLQTLIDYTRISDDDYFRDIDTASLTINRATHLRQHAELNYLTPYLSMGTAVSRYQTIDPNISPLDRPVRSLPSAWLKFETPKKLNRPVVGGEFRFASFEHQTRTEADRSYADITLSLPAQLSGIYITPKIGVEHLYYAISNVDTATDPALSEGQSLSYSAPYGDLKIAAIFEKHGTKHVSTLEPALHYHYQKIAGNRNDALIAPNFDSDWLSFDGRALSRESRLSGYDGIEETNQLASTLSHRLNRRDGSPLLATTVGYLQYFQQVARRYSDLDAVSIFDDALQTNNQSAGLVDMRAYLNRQWQTSLSTLWDERRNRIEAGQAAIHFHRRNNALDTTSDAQVFNLRYHYRRAEPSRSLLSQNIEQLDANFVTPIGRSFGLLGRFQYDIQANRSIETLAGGQYESCCIKLRLVYRDGLIYDVDNPSNESHDRSVFLQIQFKGLMGIGNTVENLLEESLFGYRSTQY